MVVITQVVVDVLHVVERSLQLRQRNLGGTESITPHAQAQATTTSTSPTMSSTNTSSGNGGPTSSPLLFFVALGFGVVFTNLWIIVGVKYCFRYNARNRAIRNGEDPDPIDLANMPRPHRRRREKKLMTMDEVNERFPLLKYKAWVASRAREGLSTSGGVTAPSSRAGSVRDVEGVIPSSPTETKHSMGTQPNNSISEDAPADTQAIDTRKSMDAKISEKLVASPLLEEHNRLEAIPTTTSTVDKHVLNSEEDDDDDDHIHTAVPPELLTNPGDSCAICIDTLEDDDDIRGLTCGHAFHAGCLDPWLTSRRACCPLCKADYFTPKPRPEGEVDPNDRAGRRRERERVANMPQTPQSAWVNNLRGSPRLFNFSSGPSDATTGAGRQQSHAERREARRALANATTEGPADNATAPASRRWMPTNLFSRNRSSPQEAPVVPSPSQLEAGTVR